MAQVYLNQVSEMTVRRPTVVEVTTPGYVNVVSRFNTSDEDVVVTGITVLNDSANVCTFDIYFRNVTQDIYLVKNMEINNYETKNPITEQTPIYLPNGNYGGFVQHNLIRFATSSNPCNFKVMVNWYSVKS